MAEGKMLPAVLHVSEGASAAIAGITLLERLIVALHRSGVEKISLVGARPPEFRRLRSLGVGVDVVPTPPAEGEVLFADGALFASQGDVARVIAARGRLLGDDGRPLPLEVRGENPSACRDVPAAAPAFVVASAEDRRRASRLLWASLGSRADGVVDRWINRPVGRIFSKLLVPTPVTPNQVTVAGTLVGLVAAWWIASPSAATALLGTLLFQLSAAIDCVDGELARVRFQESAFGKWLDIGLDQVVHLAIFVAIAVHCARRGLDLPTALLGASAVVGALASFVVVVRGQRASRVPWLADFVDRMATRDFSVVLILLAIVGRLDLFLWLAGTVSHAFWIFALVAERWTREEASPRTEVA